LVDLEVNIGRELDNTLRLADPSISRHHAVIRATADGYEVQDLGSSNGVLVNGNRVTTAPLHDGDRLTLGQMQITFVDPPPPASPLGTVRMNLDDMAKLQAVQAAAPVPLTTAEIPAPAPSAWQPPPPAPSATAPSPMPPRPPQGQAGALQPGAIQPGAIQPGAIQPGANPAPAFLQGYLPPIPDDAQPISQSGFIERGDFGTRLLAFLIDGAFGFGLAIAFWIAVTALTLITRGLGCIACALYPLVSIGYVVFMLWCQVTFRATIGKKIMKLRIVPENDPRGNIDWGMAILRLLGHLVSSMLFYLPYLLILGGERKGLQDMFSKSIVIKVDR
jgi:uncharacterized RDD family membrane protein YckC